MSKCFILTRQSSGSSDPDDSLSIEVQVKECERLAAQKSFEVVEVLRDANVSGRLYPTGYELLAEQDLAYMSFVKETKKVGQFRKGLGEALRRLDEVDYILCYDITRLFRPLNGSFLQGLVTQALTAHKVKVLTIKEGEIDFAKFQDFLVTSLTSQINSEQLLIQKEKAKAALRRLKDSGEHTAILCNRYGFTSYGSRRFVVIPEQKEIVQYIFKKYIEGVGINAIARTLNMTKRDILKGGMTPRTIKSILKSPIYCGYTYDTQGNLIKAKEIEGKAFISYGEWEQALKRLESFRGERIRKKKNWLPLSGLIKCGFCGSTMKFDTDTGSSHGRYRCKAHHLTGAKQCPSFNVVASDDDIFGVGLKECVEPLLISGVLERVRGHQDIQDDSYIESFKVEIGNITGKERTLTALFMDGSLDENTYKEAMKTAKAKKTELAEKIEIENRKKDSASDFITCMKLFSKFFKEGGLAQEDYESLVVETIRKIEVFECHIKVHTTFGEVEIPWQKIRNKHRGPNSWVFSERIDDGLPKVTLVYYFGDRRRPNGEEDEAIEIAKLGQLKVKLLLK